MKSSTWWNILTVKYLVLTKYFQLKEEKKKSLSGTDQTEQKRKNRISVLYNSMRGSKRREVKESNANGTD